MPEMDKQTLVILETDSVWVQALHTSAYARATDISGCQSIFTLQNKILAWREYIF